MTTTVITNTHIATAVSNVISLVHFFSVNLKAEESPRNLLGFIINSTIFIVEEKCSQNRSRYMDLSLWRAIDENVMS